MPGPGPYKVWVTRLIFLKCVLVTLSDVAEPPAVPHPSVAEGIRPVLIPQQP